MEVRFMDKMFNTTRIVDAYTSCIWNDEYIGYGDFELCFPMEYGSLDGINIGWYASIRESKKYMVVEGLEITTSVTEGNMLIVTGRSLESYLDGRIIQDDQMLTGNLQTCIMRLLNSNAIYPSEPNRVLPGLSFKPSQDSHVTSLSLDFELKSGDNLYDAIYVICDAYKLGFQITPLENGMMEFELYAGADRSYAQEENPWLVFSPKFENLKETDMVVDVTTKKTTAYSNSSYRLQHADGETTDELLKVVVGGDAYGFDRKEIYKEVSISVEEVDIKQFGEASDRVNIRDFQTYEPVYFDRVGYEEALEKWSSKLDSVRPEFKEERTEWKQVERAGSNEPGWQEAHPNENPNIWVKETIPGDDAATRAKKQARYNSVLEQEPSESDFMRWGWVMSDRAGYNAAIAAAQEAINSEFNAAVQDKVAQASKNAKKELEAEVAKYVSITNFHGEMDSNVQATFGTDYYLGDIVQFVNQFQFQAVTRITGITYSQEPSTGFIVKPTFTSDDEAVFEI